MPKQNEDKGRGAWRAAAISAAAALLLGVAAFFLADIVVARTGLTALLGEGASRAGSGLTGLIAALLGYIPIRRNIVQIYADVRKLPGLKPGAHEAENEAVEPPVSVEALFEKLDALEAKEALTDKNKALLQHLREKLAERTLGQLATELGVDADAVEAEAQSEKREEVEHLTVEGDAQEREALRLIAKGAVVQGLDLLEEEAEQKSLAPAQKWRSLGRLAYGKDTARALRAYEKLWALDKSDPWDGVFLGRLYQSAGRLPAAENVYAAVSQSLPEDDRRNRSVLLHELGDVQQAQGDLAAAHESYEASLEICRALAAADPSNMEWRRDLSVSHNKLGEVQQAQGDLAAARESYEASLEIARALAAADPSNSTWRQDLYVSHTFIGIVKTVQGDLSGARASYEEGLKIIAALAGADSSNMDLQRELSVSHNKIGEVQRAQGDLTGARGSYEASLEIRIALAAADPSNSQWRRDLYVSHTFIGIVKSAQGDLSGARASYEEGLKIIAALAGADSSNMDLQRELSVSHGNIGNVHVALGESQKAIASYEAGLAISEDLAARFPDTPQYQSDMDEFRARLAELRGEDAP